MSKKEKQNGEAAEPAKGKRARRSAGKAAGICAFVLSLALLIVCTVNALLAVFVEHYYPTFGEYRLFAVVSDSMEPEIPAGNMIVGRVPESEDEIEAGTVITYEARQGNSFVLITHRVIAVNRDAAGKVTYTTRGDNAEGTDAFRPAFSDVVGIYTGNRCGFFGYLFGFLHSAQGAIALIIILLIIVITYIIVRFVNLVTMWRKVALEALKASGALLADTQVEELGTIADVIGIVSKEPLDKRDIARKDKKLKWFLKTGALPRRPYSDDFEESLLQERPKAAIPRLIKADSVPVREVAREQTVEAHTSGNASRVGTGTAAFEKRAGNTASFSERLNSAKPQTRQWYALLKSELLSYKGVRARESKKCEAFFYGRRAAARLTLRGKTLCLQLALDPSRYENSKFSVERTKGGTPCRYRVKSALRARYACELIADLMNSLQAVKETK